MLSSEDLNEVLRYAAQNRCSDVVRLILYHPKIANWFDARDLERALEHTSEYGLSGIVTDILDHPKTKEWRTPRNLNKVLAYVSAKGNSDVVDRLLVYLKAPQWLTSWDLWVALYLASANRHSDVVDRLLVYPKSVELLTSWNLMTALASASNSELSAVETDYSVFSENPTKEEAERLALQALQKHVHENATWNIPSPIHEIAKTLLALQGNQNISPSTRLTLFECCTALLLRTAASDNQQQAAIMLQIIRVAMSHDASIWTLIRRLLDLAWIGLEYLTPNFVKSRLPERALVTQATPLAKVIYSHVRNNPEWFNELLGEQEGTQGKQQEPMSYEQLQNLAYPSLMKPPSHQSPYQRSLAFFKAASHQKSDEQYENILNVRGYKRLSSLELKKCALDSRSQGRAKKEKAEWL